MIFVEAPGLRPTAADRAEANQTHSDGGPQRRQANGYASVHRYCPFCAPATALHQLMGVQPGATADPASSC